MKNGFFETSMRHAAYAVKGKNPNRAIIARLSLIFYRQSISNHALLFPLSFT
jgi:hypothetical protein